ncbi:MAG: hypothetical protein H6868_06060 [Rhodospirillales bacterium]|nr:hypothetical protein [Rhodospirillales bacterium]
MEDLIEADIASGRDVASNREASPSREVAVKPQDHDIVADGGVKAAMNTKAPFNDAGIKASMDYDAAKDMVANMDVNKIPVVVYDQSQRAKMLFVDKGNDRAEGMSVRSFGRRYGEDGATTIQDYKQAYEKLQENESILPSNIADKLPAMAQRIEVLDAEQRDLARSAATGPASSSPEPPSVGGGIGGWG